MAEENVIKTNIVANSDMSGLIVDLNKVSSSLAKLQQQLSASNKNLSTQISVMNKTFAETLRSTGQYSTHFVSLTSDVDKFGQQLDKGQLKLSQFFRVYGDHAKKSGGLIRDLARQQVQLQNAVMQPIGRNAEGLMQYYVHIPRGLDEIKNKTSLVKQELAIMNKVVQEGANQLINWGKNTQWAGRQLTVGLTVPMAAFGKAASDAFRNADQELVRLTKVYGGLSATSSAELKKVRQDVTATAAELAKGYGASFNETLGLAADIAATGKQGNELLGSIKETTRLAVLGEVDRQEAMKATLAIQTAFKQNTSELAQSINFLNAVENQTSTTLADLVEAIPKAGPIIKGLGGSIQDLALYLTAMREGGVSAAEGANALKSALGALINPTQVATKMFAGFGVDLKGIVQRNAGNVTGTILELQAALDKLDPLKKQQALEQLFGKFQFARMNALFSNLGKQGSQTLQVMDLMKASSKDLANIASRELTQVTESASGKYRRALEGLKADLSGVGEQFLTISTTLINIVDGVIKFTNNLPKPIKQLLSVLGMFTATAGPIIMLTGVLGNFFGYIIKGVYHFKSLFKGAEGWKLLTPEILAATKAGNLAEQTFYSDARAAAILKQSLDALVGSYTALEAKINSGVITTGLGGAREVMANHPLLSARDTRDISHLNPVSQMTSEQRAAQTIFGVVPGAPLVNKRIGGNPQMYAAEDLPDIPGLTRVGGASSGVVAEEAAQWHAMTGALAMQSKTEIKKLKTEVAQTGLITDELSVSYQALLPEMQKLTQKAAAGSAAIVAELKAGKITMDQAKAKIIALNYEIEALMGTATTQVATNLGRNVDLTKVPLLNQPVINPTTGKSNMKELFKQGRTRGLINSIARVLGVKTYGAPYSIETTRPKKLNIGGPITGSRGNYGNVYDPSQHGAIVPGPNVNYDIMPANVPVGGFVLNKEASSANPDLVNVAVKGYSGGGKTTPAILTPGETVVDPLTYSNYKEEFDIANATRMNFGGIINPKTLTYGPIGPGTMSILKDYLERSSKIGNLRYSNVGKTYRSATTGRSKTPGTTTVSTREIGSGSLAYNDLRSRTSKVYKDSDNILYGITPTSSDQVLAHAWTPQIIRKLRQITGIKDVGALTNLTREQLLQLGLSPRSIKEFFRALPSAWIKAPSRFNQFLKSESVPSSIWASADNMPVFTGDDMQSLRIFAKDSGLTPSQTNEIANNAAKKLNDLLLNLKNREGIMNEEVFGKLVNAATVNSIAFKNNIRTSYALGGRIKSSKHNYGLTNLPLSVIQRLTARWPKAGPFEPQGRQYMLGNTDPLHGPLQIGMSQNLKRYAGHNPYDREAVLYRDPRFSKMTVQPGFLTGDEKRRGMYSAYRYMSGDLDLMRQMEQLKTHPLGPIAAMKQLQTKFTGKLYRGILGKSSYNPLPKDILNEIYLAKQTGDWSKLIGKEFVMRRSSWSKSQEIAHYFAMRGNRPDSILLEAAVKNRNVLDVSSLFPGRAFEAPHGQSYPPTRFGATARNEKESIFGGKFRIVGYNKNNGAIQLETVVEKREMGGNVNSGQPYLVGEKGPELFVPKNSGGIIPNYQIGGQIKPGRKNYGLISSAARFMLPMGASYGASAAMRKSDNPLMQNELAQIAASTGIFFAADRVMQKFGTTTVDAAAKTGKFARVMETLNLAGKAIPGWGKVAAVVLTATAAASYGAWEKARKARLASQESLKVNQKEADQLGISYTSAVDKIKQVTKAAAEQRKLLATKAAGAEQVGGGISLTVAQFEKLKKTVKETQPDIIRMFNEMSREDVVQNAANLKAQMVAAGKSAKEAAENIYAAISLSNKSNMATQAVTSADFMSIIDKATAASQAVKTFSAAIKTGAGTDKKEIAASFEASLTSIDAYYNSISKIKDANGKMVYDNQAVAKTIEEISKTEAGRQKIGQNQYETLVKQNPELRNILNKSDSIVDAWAKYKLYTEGVQADLSNISGKDAQRMLQTMESIKAAAIDLTTNSLADNNPFLLLVKTGNTAQSAAKAAKKLSDDASKNAQKNYDKEIKIIDKRIAKLNKEYEARKKLIEVQSSKESYAISLQKEQLNYQDALAAGDMASAAQASLNIRQLNIQYQKEQALRALEERHNVEIEKANKEKEATQERIAKLQEKAAKLAEAAAKAQQRANSIAAIQQSIALTLSAAAMTDDKEKLKQLAKAYQSDVEALSKLDKKAAAALTPASTVADVTYTKSGGLNVKQVPDWLNTLLKNKESVMDKATTEAFEKFGMSVYDFGVYVAQLKGLKPPSKPAAGNTGTEIGNPKVKSVEGKNVGEAARNAVAGKIQSQKFQDDSGIWTKFKYKGKTYVVSQDETTIYEYDENKKQRVGSRLKPDYVPEGYAQGGLLKHYEPGGNVKGPGTATSDSIPAMLSNGEYVVRASAVEKYGVPFFDAVNAQKFAEGGIINLPGQLNDLKNIIGSMDWSWLKKSKRQLREEKRQRDQEQLKKLLESLRKQFGFATGAANGGYINFATGGYAMPKFNIPTPKPNIVNPAMMGYNKGGEVHRYDIGGLVLNPPPGTDNREIASMVVTMLESKNLLAEAKSGRGRVA